MNPPTQRGTTWCGEVSQKTLDLVRFDHETKKIYKLLLAFSLQGVFKALTKNIRIAVVGHMMGTKALTAYVIVGLFTGPPGNLFSGVHDGCTTLLSHSVGTKNDKLTGEYLQIALVLDTLLPIPLMIMWYYVMEPLLLALGFDEETAQMGKDFCLPYVLTTTFKGLFECVRRLLDVEGHQNFSSFLIVSGEVVLTLAVWAAAAYGEPSLQDVGLMYLLVAVLTFLITVLAAVINGWIQRFYVGLIHSFSFRNTGAVKVVLKTATPISLVHLFLISEWQALAFIATFMGPDAVAAWGIVGEVWGALDELRQACGDAAAIRCALLLGSAEPDCAKRSAAKSLFHGTLSAVVVSAIVLSLSGWIPSWLTTDTTLQEMVQQCLGFLVFGHIVATTGRAGNFLIGSQGRFGLATAVFCVGSWLFTLPLSAVTTIALGLDLYYQMGAIALGYTVNAALCLFVLFTRRGSDWNRLSLEVVQYNKEHDIAVVPDDLSTESFGSSGMEYTRKSTVETASDIDESLQGGRAPTNESSAELTLEICV